MGADRQARKPAGSSSGVAASRDEACHAVEENYRRFAGG
jgi:hypothetical protein